MAHIDAEENGAHSKLRLLYNFLLYVSPVALLMVVFPIVTPELGRYHIGGAPLIHIILAASITVPWLSQAACMPIYRAIELERARTRKARIGLENNLKTAQQNEDAQELQALTQRLSSRRYQPLTDVGAFARCWLYLFLTGLPLILLFALPLIIFLHWSPTAMAVFFALSVLNLAFAQLLILPNLSKRREEWFFAWLGYAAVLLFFPLVWFLPPLVGSLILLTTMRRDIGQIKYATGTPAKYVVQDAWRGLTAGAVLWSDKYVLFIAANGQINVLAIYISLIPCVLAYNFFFVAEAERVNETIKKLWGTFEKLPYAKVTSTAQQATSASNSAIMRTMAVDIFASVFTGLFMLIFMPHVFPVGFAGIIVAGLFLLVTLCNYQIEFMGLYRTAQLLGLAHLLLVCIVFAIIPHEGGYFPLIIGEAVLAAVAYAFYRRAWASPEYSLFWRRALAW